MVPPNERAEMWGDVARDPALQGYDDVHMPREEEQSGGQGDGQNAGQGGTGGPNGAEDEYDDG